MEWTGSTIGRLGLRMVLFWCAGSGLLHAADAKSDFVTRDVTDQYRIRFWNAENGLPANRIQSIAQTPDGYLWLGTYFGLVRFDGNKFEVFNRSTTPELGHDDVDIRALETDLEGNLWIGTKSGLLRYANGQFSRFTRQDGLPDNRVWKLKILADGTLWVSTERGVARYRNHRFECFHQEDWKGPLQVSQVCSDYGEVTLQLADRSTWRFNSNNGQFEPFVVNPPGLSPWPAAGAKVLPTRDFAGRVWARCLRNVQCFQTRSERNRGGTWSVEKTLGDAGDNDRFTLWTPIFKDRDDRVWFTTELGAIGCWGTSEVAEVRLNHLHAVTGVVCMFQGRDGTFWVGAEEGLFQLLERPVRSYQSKSSQFPGRYVFTITSTTNDIVLAGLSAHLMIISNNVTSTFPFADNARYGVTGLVAKNLKEIFLNLGGLGPKVLKNLREGPAGLANIPGSMDVTTSCLSMDHQGRLWIGTKTGAWEYNMATAFLENVTSNRFHRAVDVRCCFEDSAGGMWFGTAGNGLIRMSGTNWETFTSGTGFVDENAWTIHESPPGTFWIGTANGLSRYKDGRFFNFTTINGYPESTINMILEDNDGMLWFSGLKGIYRIDPKELNAVADGRASSFSVLSIGEADGMLSSETNGERQPAGCKTSDGRLWFPTINGVVAIDPARFRDSVASNAAPPVIESVLVDNQIEFDNGVDQRNAAIGKLDKDFVLAPGRARSVEIRYTANNFDAPHKVRFWVRMSGMDDHWHDMGNRRTRFYNDLKPGKYHFEVKTADHHGRVSPEIAGFSFIVLPHYYETGWFSCLFAAVVLGLGYAAHRWRLSIIGRLQRLDKLEALTRERERIARDIHDDIGNQITQIKLLAEMSRKRAESDAPADPHLDKMANVARAALQALGEIVWTTNPRNDTLRGLAEFLCQVGEEILQMAGIAVRVKSPAGLPELIVEPRIRHELLLVFKEVLNNIVVHAGASEVHLEMKLEDREFIVIVRDNGRGFDPAGNGRSRAGGGNGLGNIRARMEGLNGGLAIHSEAGEGTSIVLTVTL